MTVTLNFQGQIWTLPYRSQIWSYCHETESKHIDWSKSLKCDQWVWPWPWPWIFKVKYGICNISAKNGLIATKQKANILIDSKASNVTIGFDLDHDLDHEFSRSNMEYTISQPKMVQLSWNEKQTYQLSFRPQMWPSDLALAMNSTLNFQGQIWNLLYLNPKWPNCNERKSKHIDWTLGLKCNQRIWPWPWPWPLYFQGQMWPWPLITYMALTKDFHISMKFYLNFKGFQSWNCTWKCHLENGCCTVWAPMC